MSQANLRNVPQVDRRPLAGRYDNAFQIFSRTSQTLAIDHQLVAAPLDVTAAGILVILGHRCLNLPQGEAQAGQAIGVHEHVVLF